MSRFTRPLIVSPLPDGRSWVLRQEFSYDIGYEGSGEFITIPLGFVTDFASIPRFFWNIFPKWGKYGNAAVVHDYLYWDQFFSREKTDKIFLEGMEILDVKKITRNVIYKSVRIFGHDAWAENKKNRRKGKIKIIDLSDW